MAQNTNVQLLIQAAVKGLSEVNGLITELNGLGESTEEASAEATRLAAELERLGAQQKLITQFGDLKAKTGETAQALEEARAKATNLGRELATTEQPTAQLRSEFERSRKAVNDLEKKYQGQTVALQKMRGDLSAAGISTKDLANSQVQTRKALADTSVSVEALTGSLRNNVAASRNAAQAAQKIADARKQLNLIPHKQIADEINQVRQAYQTLKSSGTLTHAELAQASLQMERRIAELNAQTNGWADALGTVKGQIAGLAAASAGLVAAGKQAVDFETAMANVRKVVDMTDDQFAELTGQIKQMATELPIGADGLAAIAEQAGQLGIAGDDIGKFTQLVAKMGTAFNMMPEQAGEAIAKMRNVFQLPLQDMEALGDAVNVLGNNMAATERDIIQVMTRIGGTGKQFGLVAEETAALSAAFLSLGRRPEVAATAINALLSKLQTANVAGEKFTSALADMGISAEQLASDINEHPQQALQEFLRALQQLDKQSRAEIITRLFGLEYQDDIALLIGSLGEYEKAVALVGDRANTAGAMQDEFAQRMKTTQAQIDLLKNSIEVAAINLGTAFLPAVNAVAGGLTTAANAVADFVEHFPGISAAAATVATLAGSIGALKIAFSALGLAAAKGIASAKAGLKALTVEVNAATVATNRLGTAFHVLGAALVGWEIGNYLRDQFEILRTESERIEAEMRRTAEQTGAHLTRIASERSAELAQYRDESIATAEELGKLAEDEIAAYQERIEAAKRYWGYQLELGKLLKDDSLIGEATRKIAAYQAALEASAKAAGDVADRMERMARASDAFLSQADQIARSALAARELADQLNDAASASENAAEDVAKLINGLDLANPQVIEQLAQAMGMLRSESADAAAMVEQQLVGAIAKLDGRQLQAFSTALKGAFAAGSMAAEELAEIADVVLAESFKRLGLTAETALGRISPAAQGAIASLDAIRASLVGAADEGAAKMAALGNAITATLARADTPAAVEQIRLRIEAMGESGELAGQQLEEAMRRARERMDDLKPGINSVEEAFRKLGITSQAALRQAADEAREAYQVIRSGGTTIAEQQQAWLAWASAAVKSGDEATLALVRAEGQALGLTDELTKMGLAGEEAGKKIAGGANEAANAFDQLRAGIDSATDITTLNQWRDAALQVYRDGTISAEEYSASVDQAHEKEYQLVHATSTFAQALAAHLDRLRNEFYQFGEGAAAAFDKVVERSTIAGGSVWHFLDRLEEGTETLRFLVQQETDAYARLMEQLADTDNVTAGLVRRAESAADSFEYLGEQQLEPLRNAIASARAEMEALAESASRTLDSLQDELDRLDGREEALAQRRAERRRAEIEAQLEEAKAHRNTEAIRDLEESLRLADEIAKREQAKAREAEKERAAREAERQAERQDADRQQRETRTTTTTTTPREPAQPVRTVRIDLALGGKSTSFDVLAGQEDAVEQFFRELERSKWSAQ